MAAIVVGAAVGLAVLEHRKKEARKATQRQLESIERRRVSDDRYWITWEKQHPKETNFKLPKMQRPLRLLSIDGGGVRGIIALIVLQRIMDRLAPAPGVEILPCEYFDLIGGTSTGGLIAIMLGKLRMSISECIDVYCKMSKQVFKLHSLPKHTRLIMDGHKFSGIKLGEVVDQVVNQYRGQTDTKMQDPRVFQGPEYGCRTFAVAIPGCDIRQGPKLFRSYHNHVKRKTADTCEIWEVARATACAPSFFPEISIDGVIYSDGGLGNNNPARLLLGEARSLWGIDHKIDCLISLGTGGVSSDLYRVRNILEAIGMFGVFKRMVTDCEQVHQELHQDSDLDGIYHRFNPVLSKDIGLEEWEKIPVLTEIARNYLQEHELELTQCVSTLFT